MCVCAAHEGRVWEDEEEKEICVGIRWRADVVKMHGSINDNTDGEDMHMEILKLWRKE